MQPMGRTRGQWQMHKLAAMTRINRKAGVAGVAQESSQVTMPPMGGQYMRTAADAEDGIANADTQGGRCGRYERRLLRIDAVHGETVQVDSGRCTRGL